MLTDRRGKSFNRHRQSLSFDVECSQYDFDANKIAYRLVEKKKY